jgi:hypothetical protein
MLKDTEYTFHFCSDKAYKLEKMALTLERMFELVGKTYQLN